MKKENAFKNYIIHRKGKLFPFSDVKVDVPAEKYPSMETSFGSHSLVVLGQAYPSMETSFGSHSLATKCNNPKLTEEYSTTPGKITASEQIDNHHVHRMESVGSIHDRNKLKKNDALYKYSVRSQRYNGALHEKIIPDHIKQDIKSIDKSLDSASIDHDTHVYTGMRHSPAGYFTGSGTAKVHLPAYTSTSTDYGVACVFAKLHAHSAEQIAKHTPINSDCKHYDPAASTRHVLKLHLPKGTKAGSVMHFSKYDDEHEILLHRGHNIEIHPHPTVDQHNVNVWHARVISHTPDKINE